MKIKQIFFIIIINKIKIKCITHFPIFILDIWLQPIDIKDIIKYFVYKYILRNLNNVSIPTINSNSTKIHSSLKRSWNKDSISWLDNWGIVEDGFLQDINNFKSIIITNFKYYGDSRIRES